MSYVRLSDEETRVIFAGEAAEGFAGLDAQGQEEVITKLLNVVSNEAPPSNLVYESITNLDIFAVGDQGRLYTKVVDGIPQGNIRYNVIFLFFIDISHGYHHGTLAEYSRRAEVMAAEITALDSVPDVEDYLEDHGALDEEDLRDLLP